jgi:hypothetical protein
LLADGVATPVLVTMEASDESLTDHTTAVSELPFTLAE